MAAPGLWFRTSIRASRSLLSAPLLPPSLALDFGNALDHPPALPFLHLLSACSEAELRG